jgi:tripartite-type tricarboxylate transporter receptor subunit TctC
MFRALLLLAFAATANAQSYPNKPIRWIVPYTGGGITDVVTRIVTQKMSGPLGQPVVVDNRPGANSILGSDLGAKAAPDGYTMLTVIAGYAANVTLYQGKLPFDPMKDLVPVSLAGIAPLIMTVNPNLPAKDVKELIAYAKANPGKLNFGSSGIGAAAHLTCELFKQTAGIDMVHIPFKGTAPATQAVIANDIQILVDTPSSMMAHVRGGKLRALGMFSGKRLTAFPDVPTIGEAGGPPLESSTWVLFMAPGGTPKAIIDRLAAETGKAINESEIKDRFTQLGIEPVGNSPEEAKRFLDAEINKWSRVINTAGVKAEQ